MLPEQAILWAFRGSGYSFDDMRAIDIGTY